MDRMLRHVSRRWIQRAMAGLTSAMVVMGLGMVSPQALAGISVTKHNLGSSGIGTNNKFDGTGEICVFCHTPHGADTTAVVPLWNRTLGATTYTTYNSLGTSSLDGSTAPVGSVSLACLSCHDGSQAMNVMINTPGSGTTTTLAGAWTGANQTAGKITGAMSNLGTNMQNDHPIGIQYGGGPSGTLPAAPNAYTTFRDADFKAAQSDTINNQPVWWVDTGTTGLNSRQKTDMQLYTRTDQLAMNAAGTAATTDVLAGAQPYVECASCHDPHSENPTFLRIANTGSAVCLACHTK